MPEFTYTARTADGQSRIGTLFSAGPGQVVSDLRGRGWIVLDVRATSEARDHATDVTDLHNAANWLEFITGLPFWIATVVLPATRFDVEIGLQQLATMIRSGLSLLTSIKTAGEQVRRPAMQRVWNRIYGEIEGGSSFSDAIAAERRYFPPMVVQLVHVGESSGTLETVLAQAADHLERARGLRMTLLTALIYPMLVLLLSIGVTAYMVFVVLPILQKFIVHQGHKLPPLTQNLINVTNWLNTHATLILISTLIAIVSIVVMRRIRSTRLWMDGTLLRVPIVGGILRLAGTASMSRGMSLLLENGINLLDAIQITHGLIANRAMQGRLEMTRQAVIEGQPLAESLLAGREFLPMLGRMAAVGEATGTLDVVLGEVARYHEAQLAGAVKRLSVMIEPAITLVVGGIVGFVYIAFFLALFSAGGVR